MMTLQAHRAGPPGQLRHLVLQQPLTQVPIDGCQVHRFRYEQGLLLSDNCLAYAVQHGVAGDIQPAEQDLTEVHVPMQGKSLSAST